MNKTKRNIFNSFQSPLPPIKNKATMNSRFSLLMDAAQETRKNQFHLPNINLSLNFVITSFCLFVCFIVSSTIPIDLSRNAHDHWNFKILFDTQTNAQRCTRSQSRRNDEINLICFFYDSINKSMKRNIHENGTIRNWSDAIDIAKKESKWRWCKYQGKKRLTRENYQHGVKKWHAKVKPEPKTLNCLLKTNRYIV